MDQCNPGLSALISKTLGVEKSVWLKKLDKLEVGFPNLSIPLALYDRVVLTFCEYRRSYPTQRTKLSETNGQLSSRRTKRNWRIT